jgi:hypothetical protein
MSFRPTYGFFARRTSSTHRRRTHAIEQMEARWTMDAIAISELMYAPQGDANAEYIEVQNTSGLTMNLQNYRFSAGIQFIFPSFDLAPGQVAVIAKDPPALAVKFGVVPNLIGIYSGSLDNSGETIRLETPTGAIAQEFSYNQWYPELTLAQGYSLVPVVVGATTPTPSEKEHWRPSGKFGGSPGTVDVGIAPGSVIINELLAHTDIDTFGDWIELKNTTSTPIDISGWYLSDKGDELQRFRVPNGTVIQPGGFVTFTQYDGLLVPSDFFKTDPSNPHSVPFQFYELGETAYLTQGYADGSLGGFRIEQPFGADEREVPFGRFTKSNGGTDFTALAEKTMGQENSGPLIGPIVINELLYAPLLGTDEFIELRNVKSQPIPLFHPTETTSTWKFVDGVEFQFPQGQVIPAGGLALVVPIDPATFRAKYSIPAAIPIYGPYVGTLADGGEEVKIAKPGDIQNDPTAPDFGVVPYYVVDRVNYTTSAPWPDGTNNGPSLARINATGYGNDGANWKPGIVGGTPGGANSTTITVSAENDTVVEPDTGIVEAFITVRLSDSSNQVVTVAFTTQGDQATSPADFEAQSGILTFQPSETVKVVTVAVKGDAIDEPSEDFDVVLSNPNNVTLGDPTGRVTITDNDPGPMLVISDASATEGNGGVPFAVVTLSLSALSEKTITLQFATANGTAVSPADYQSATGTVTFLPNTPTLTVTIPLIGDSIIEGNENFVVNFTAPNNVTLPTTPQAIVTIIDDDSPLPPWQNPVLRWDVDGQDGVSALDVLILVNRINSTGGGELPPPSGGAPPPYYDVDGNGHLEALDVLNVVNYINALPPQQLVASGLSTSPIQEVHRAEIGVSDDQSTTVEVAPRSIAVPPNNTSYLTVAQSDDDLPPRVADELELALDELLLYVPSTRLRHQSPAGDARTTIRLQKSIGHPAVPWHPCSKLGQI